MQRHIYSIIIIVLCYACKQSTSFHFTNEKEFIADNRFLSDTAQLGKHIFFDTNLSEPKGISCGSCHSPSAAFSDKRHTSFSVGVNNKMGNRNTPALSYNILAPHRHPEELRGILELVGGFFWDGRAPELEAQAFSPFTNKNEMNNKSIDDLAIKIRQASYFKDFEKIFGKQGLHDNQVLLLLSTLALKTFQTSIQVNPYTSKFDLYLAGKATLSPSEIRGWNLFNDTTKTQCSICHLTEKDSRTNTILFTDFSYENLGIPKHPNQKYIGIDSGFAKAEFILELNEIGKFKTPSLRNVGITAPYMHNGIFSTLEEVLSFYNSRDVDAQFIPEYAPTMNTDNLGDLKLNHQEIKDIIAFLHTLTDGYCPSK